MAASPPRGERETREEREERRAREDLRRDRQRWEKLYLLFPPENPVSERAFTPVLARAAAPVRTRAADRQR